MKLAFSVDGAGRPWSIGGTGVVANKDVAFKRGQSVFLLDGDDSCTMMSAANSRVTVLATP
jgi:hypothetical protein